MMIKSSDPSKMILLGKMVILEVGIPVLGSVTTMGIGESQDGGHGALTPFGGRRRPPWRHKHPMPQGWPTWSKWFPGKLLLWHEVPDVQTLQFSFPLVSHRYSALSLFFFLLDSLSLYRFYTCTMLHRFSDLVGRLREGHPWPVDFPSEACIETTCSTIHPTFPPISCN